MKKQTLVEESKTPGILIESNILQQNCCRPGDARAGMVIMLYFSDYPESTRLLTLSGVNGASGSGLALGFSGNTSSVRETS